MILTETSNDHIKISTKMNLADHQFETYTMISVTLLKYPCVVVHGLNW